MTGKLLTTEASSFLEFDLYNDYRYVEPCILNVLDQGSTVKLA